MLRFLMTAAVTPFAQFCALVFGPGYTPSQVGEALGVSRDTVRSWLKRDDMPTGRAILLYVVRLQQAADLVPTRQFTDEEIQRILDGSQLSTKGPK